MDYIILTVPDFAINIYNVIDNLPDNVRQYLNNCKIMYLSPEEIKKRLCFKNELVIISMEHQEDQYFLNQWAKNSNRYFMLFGTPKHCFPANFVGYFKTKNQLKDNLINYYQLICRKQSIKVGKYQSVYISEIIYAEIKCRKLNIYTNDKQYKLGYIALKTFLSRTQNYLTLVNRHTCVNFDYIKDMTSDYNIILDGTDKLIRCSKMKFKSIKSKSYN